MKRNGIRLIMALCTLVLSINLLAMGTMAAETAVIPVQILLEGTGQQTEEVFTVELTSETSEAPMPPGSENGCCRVKLRGETSVSIQIPCDREGVFSYTLRQLPGENPACTYDDRVYDLIVYATRSERGELDVAAVVTGSSGEKQDSVVFRNAYAQPVSISLTARKTLDGKTPEDGTFFFRLLDAEGKTVFETENQGRSVAFPALRFQEAGTWIYYLKEVKGDDSRIIYDRTVYTAVVEVTRDWRITVTWERNGKPYAGIPAFANYTDTGVPKTGDSIGLYLTGLTLSAAALILLPMRKRRK